MAIDDKYFQGRTKKSIDTIIPTPLFLEIIAANLPHPKAPNKKLPTIKYIVILNSDTLGSTLWA